jgi:hypothetical protein
MTWGGDELLAIASVVLGSNTIGNPKTLIQWSSGQEHVEGRIKWTNSERSK